jgi:hypothetical protein
MSQDENVVLLRTFGYRHDGEFARNTLETAGIQSALLVDDAGGAKIGMSFSNPARLLVRQEDVAAARAVLEGAGLPP